MISLRRRIFLAAGTAVAPTLVWGHEQAKQSTRVSPGRSTVGRSSLLAEAEALLATGKSVEALDAFEKIAATEHSADVELSIVRSHMQAGAYRTALAFCAHAAGAHPEFAAGGALYAVLLHIGGQREVALQIITKSLQLHNDNPVLLAAKHIISTQDPQFDPILLKTPWRAAPYAIGVNVPPEAKHIGTGLLMPNGEHAIIPSFANGSGHSILVRNGIGQTSVAQIVSNSASLTLVKLVNAMPKLPAPIFANREPIAGSPSRLVHYTEQASREAAWPILRSSFFRVLPQNETQRPLGFLISPQHVGGPVFDQFGQICGLAIRDRDGVDRLLPLSEITIHLEQPTGIFTSAIQTNAAINETKVANDLLYERSLLCALQVFGDAG